VSWLLERSRIWRESSLQKAEPAPELLEELRLGMLRRSGMASLERILRAWPPEKVPHRHRVEEVATQNPLCSPLEPRSHRVGKHVGKHGDDDKESKLASKQRKPPKN
jgi:hypothetical protein